MPVGGVDAGVSDRAFRAAVVERNTVEDASSSPLEKLLSRPSPLERLVADAGALGRFRTDVPDALPAGTSAFTRRSVDITDNVAARLGLPRERVWAGATVQLPMAVPPPTPTVAPQPGVAAPVGTTGVNAPRPAVATDAGNDLAGGLAGNSAAVRA
jgi:hypothetical protein